MRALLAIALVLVGGCYTNAFSNRATEKKIQRRDLAKALPAPLAVDTPVPGEARTAHVRVWVDEDFRSQNLHWRTQIEEQIDEANQFLVPAIGVRLDVKAMEPWPTRSADRKLEDVLAALEQQDHGDGVDWVIGYASSLSLVGATFETLGVARPFGRHLVVRGFADGAERAAFARVYPDTNDEERDRVHQARRRHKQTAILLHELAHTLGVPHENDASWLMHGAYDPHMATMSERSREIMRITLETWLGTSAVWDPRATAARLQSYFESNPWGGWVEGDVALLTAELRAIAAQPGAGPAALTVPAAAYDQFHRAQGLAQAGKLAEARAELDALVAAYPATPDIRVAICEVAVAADGPTADTAVKACTRAAEVAPDDPRPYFARALPLVKAGDAAGAAALIAKVEAIAGERAPLWLELAGFYQGQGLLTRAEAAAARANALEAGSADDIAGWARRTRARYGLPPDGKKWKIAEADERAYVDAVRAILDAIYANKLAEARQLADAADRKWKKAPGILAARCDLALRSNQLPAARGLCEQAIKAWSGAAWALYLRGVVMLQSDPGKKSTQAAIASLRAAIAAEPELSQAYRALGKALERAGDSAGHDALDADYQARFHSKLP